MVERVLKSCGGGRSLRLRGFRVDQIAQQHQSRVLAFDLPGVDAGLDEDDLLARPARRLGRELAAARRDDEHQVAAFRRNAEARQLELVGCGGRELLQIGARIGITWRRFEMRGFRGRDPVVRVRACGADGEQAENRSKPARHHGRGGAGMSGSLSGPAAPPESMKAIA